MNLPDWTCPACDDSNAAEELACANDNLFPREHGSLHAVPCSYVRAEDGATASVASLWSLVVLDTATGRRTVHIIEESREHCIAEAAGLLALPAWSAGSAVMVVPFVPEHAEALILAED